MAEKTELEIGLEAIAKQTKKDVDAKLETLKGDIEKLSVKPETVKELQEKIELTEKAARIQGEEITKMRNEMQSGGSADNSLRAQISKWMEANKSGIAAIKSGTKADLEPMVLKAVHTMTLATDAASPVPYYRYNGAEIIDLVRNKPTFWNRLRKGRTGQPAYTWINKTNKEGNAQFIGEGVLKPLASFSLSPEVSVPKKVAEAMKASTELLYDVEGMESLIRDELEYEVMMAANTAVLTGTASSTSPAGITTLSTAYTLTTIKTTNPNNYDAIRAAQAQLNTLNFDRDIVAFVNPVDAANMDLAKAVSSGVYLLPPFTTADGRNVGGITVIEDNNIAVGYLLIADMSKYRVLMYQDFFVAMGWENDDFRKNLVTILGEMRFHQFRSANHAGSSIYDTFANIKTLLTPA